MLVCLPVTGEARCPMLRVGAGRPKPHSLSPKLTSVHLLTPMSPSTDSELKWGKKKSHVDTIKSHGPNLAPRNWQLIRILISH